MSDVTDVPVASFNARWNAAFAKLGLGAKPSDFVRELSNTIGPPVPSLRQVAHKLCTERRRSFSPAEAFRSRDAERKVQQRKRLKEETVPERTERVAAEAEQKAKAKVAAANKAEQKAKAKVAAANKAEQKAKAKVAAANKAELQGISKRKEESNRRHDSLQHAVNRTETDGFFFLCYLKIKKKKIKQRRPGRVPRFIGAYHHRHTPCLCVGCEGPRQASAAELCSVARQSCSVVKPNNLILSHLS
jgi:hypothetical protein